MKNKKVGVTTKPVIIPSTKTEKSTTSSQTAISNIHCYACEMENDIKEAEIGNSLRWVLKLNF